MDTRTNPDDPYRVEGGFTDDGGFRIQVSADVLPGGDTSEVRAECQRRAEALKALLLSSLPSV